METSEIVAHVPCDVEGALAETSEAQELGGPLMEDPRTEGLLAEEEEDDDGTYHWQEVLTAVKMDDVRRIRFLELFQDTYDIATSVDALVHAPEFLNGFLLNEFDYRAFIQSTGR